MKVIRRLGVEELPIKHNTLKRRKTGKYLLATKSKVSGRYGKIITESDPLQCDIIEAFDIKLE